MGTGEGPGHRLSQQPPDEYVQQTLLAVELGGQPHLPGDGSQVWGIKGFLGLEVEGPLRKEQTVWGAELERVGRLRLESHVAAAGGSRPRTGACGEAWLSSERLRGDLERLDHVLARMPGQGTEAQRGVGCGVMRRTLAGKD